MGENAARLLRLVVQLLKSSEDLQNEVTFYVKGQASGLWPIEKLTLNTF